MLKLLCYGLSLFWIIAAGGAPASVKVSDFNPGREDAAKAIQQAINSGAAQVIFDNPGFEMLVGKTIFLRSDQELIFQDGVVINAKADCFKPRAAALFAGTNLKNIGLRGEGKAILKMRKQDYQDATHYEASEWRHLLAFRGCVNIKVQNLSLLSSGGDGIYLGCTPEHPYCNDVLLEDLIVDDHHRQGISVISSENLVIRRCKVLNTHGTAPAAGIDFEPNHTPPGQRIVNCLIEDSEFSGNDNAGVCIYNVYLEGGRPPQSLTFRRNIINGNNIGGVKITTSFYRQGRESIAPPSGFIKFEDCRIGNSNGPAIIVADQIPGVDVSFDNCSIEAQKGAVLLASRGMRGAPIGGVTFNNLQISKLPAGQEAITFKTWTEVNLAEITGTVSVDGRPYPLAERIKELNRQIDEQNRNGFRKGSVNWRTFRKPEQAAGAETVKNTLGHRGEFVYLVAAGAGEKVDVNIEVVHKPSMRTLKLDVTDVKNNPLASCTLAGKDRQGTLSFVAPYDGSYIIKGASGPDVLSITTSAAGGTLVNNNLLLSGRKNRAYFAVPAEVKSFELRVAGRLGLPPVKARVLNSAGQVVMSKDHIEEPHVFKIERNNSQREIWSLEVEISTDKDIAEINFGRNLENVIAASPDKLPEYTGKNTAAGTVMQAGEFTGHEN